MPYITEPPWARWGQLGALATRYALLLALGYAATHLTAHGPRLVIAGWVVTVTAAAALAGVLGHYYRAEWVALSPMIAGLAWVAILIRGSADQIVTLLVVALAAAQLDRLVHLSRVAHKLRRRRERP